MLKMQHDNVLLMPLPREEKMGSIYIPESADASHIRYRVLAVGPGKLLSNGVRIPMEVKVGDLVVAAKFNGTQIVIDGRTLCILSIAQILLVLEESPSLLGDLASALKANG